MTVLAKPHFDAPLTACPLCHSEDLFPYDHDYLNVSVHCCRSCQLLFMNPQYTDRHLTEYYALYTPHHVPRDTAIFQRRRMSKMDDLVLIERFVPPQRFLSIGCGDGLELEMARERGWHVEGFDVDEETTQRVAARANLKIHCGNFFDLPWETDAYDCVFMDQVLEHPKNPQDYLVAVHRLLRPGGVLFIGCPNIDSISNRYKGWLGRLGLKHQRRGKHYETSHHLFYYAPKVLKGLVERLYGFEVVAIEGDPLNGQKPFVPGSTRWDRATLPLRKKFPILDSTFRMVCRKVAAESAQGSRAA